MVANKSLGQSTDSVDLEKETYQRSQIKTTLTNDELQVTLNSERKTKLIHLAPFLVLICVILFVSRNSTFGSSSTSTTQLISATIPSTIKIEDYTSNQLSIQATNMYGHYEGNYPFLSEYVGSQLVEPYKATTIKLHGSLASSVSHSFIWEVETLADTHFEGSEISLTITSAEKPVLSVNIHVYDNNKYISTWKTYLIVKYVKRDIRSLKHSDREAFLNAAHTIWEYTTTEGQAKYGPLFTGIHTFVREHARASEDIMCDGYHEGTGFLTHHLALSNSFEAALRAVDPSVTLPYWDFSREGQVIADLGESPSYLQQISPVFTHDWFGEVDKNNHIKNSRWAHSLMPLKDATEDGDTSTSTSSSTGSVTYPTNSYGYYRSYWNNNNDPEVTRALFNVCGIEDTYKPIATCQMHYDVLNVSTLAAFQTLSPTDGHGPLHVQIGGVYGACSDAYKAFTAKWADYLQEDLSEEYITSTGQEYNSFVNKWGATAQRQLMLEKTVMSEYYRIYRGFWRSHMCAVDGSSALLECPSTCSVATDSFEDCSCSVPKLTSGATTWENMFPCVVFSKENRDFFSKTMSGEFMADLTNMIASNSLKEGEMMHSGSPADIMFWMIHPVIERLLAAKRLTTVTDMGGVQFNKWDVNAVDATSDSWLSYSTYNLAEGENAFYPQAYTCPGHAADDAVLPTALPFTSVIASTADRDSNGVVSNWEFYLSLDPNDVTRNDYVFDHFEWDHCTDGAIDVSAISNSKLNTATAPATAKARRVLDTSASIAVASSGSGGSKVSMNATATSGSVLVPTVVLESNFAFAGIMIVLAVALLALIWSQSGLDGNSKNSSSSSLDDDEVRYDSEVQPLLNQSSKFAPHARM